MALVAIVVSYVHCSVEPPDLCTQIVLNSAEMKMQILHCCSMCLRLKPLVMLHLALRDSQNDEGSRLFVAECLGSTSSIDLRSRQFHFLKGSRPRARAYACVHKVTETIYSTAGIRSHF